jgi:hypothetical protein
MAAAYQHASDYVPDCPPYSGVIKADGTWVACEANSAEWDAYVAWAAADPANVPDPYLHPEQGGVTLVVPPDTVPYGTMLDSIPPDAGGNPVPGLPPKNVDVPQVQPGMANVGDELSCTMGNWEGEPKLYSSVWMSDVETQIAAGTTYVVQPGDAGHSLTSVVTATNDYGATEAPPSNAVAIAAAVVASAPETARSVPRQEPEAEQHEGNHRRHRRE